MVHRDMRSVSKRLPSGPFVVLAGPGADHRGACSVNDGLTGYREVAAGGGGTLAVPVGLRQPMLNLGMILSTKCNVRINLRSMVRRIFLITLAG
jgi:hypothetical protein